MQTLYQERLGELLNRAGAENVSDGTEGGGLRFMQIKALFGDEIEDLQSFEEKFRFSVRNVIHGYNKLIMMEDVEEDFCHVETVYEDDLFYYREHVFIHKPHEDDDGPAFVMTARRDAQLEYGTEHFTDVLFVFISDNETSEAAVEWVRATFDRKVTKDMVFNFTSLAQWFQNRRNLALDPAEEKEMIENIGRLAQSLLMS